jgi:hypothetical protein
MELNHHLRLGQAPLCLLSYSRVEHIKRATQFLSLAFLKMLNVEVV